MSAPDSYIGASWRKKLRYDGPNEGPLTCLSWEGRIASPFGSVTGPKVSKKLSDIKQGVKKDVNGLQSAKTGGSEQYHRHYLR